MACSKVHAIELISISSLHPVVLRVEQVLQDIAELLDSAKQNNLITAARASLLLVPAAYLQTLWHLIWFWRLFHKASY